ncbi:TPA: pilin [Photobacterium damselae]
MKGQKGFTLIELMIVVAVIGVLAAIAIPQYQRYVAKAEVASALATMSGVKTNVEAYTVENGQFPDGVSAATSLGVPSTEVGTIELSKTGNTDGGSIIFEFYSTASAGVSSFVSEKSFKLTRSANGGWTCSTGGGEEATGIDSALLPKNCR